MPSTTLYPPIVNAYMPAFQVAPGETETVNNICPINFIISKYNIPSEIKQIQITVSKQDTGVNVLNLNDTIDEETASNSRYRATGILLLDFPEGIGSLGLNDIYTINLYDNDIDCSLEKGNSFFEGFIPGWIYKIQMRFSYRSFSNSGITQAQWLQENASYFSEWSTICMVKPIGNINLNVTNLITNNAPSGDNLSYPSDSLEIFGSLTSVHDETEILYSYQVKLFDINHLLLEDSNVIIANNYNNINELHYLFSCELKENTSYFLNVSYTTNNNYSACIEVELKASFSAGLGADIYVTYLESRGLSNISKLSSLGSEEDEGRIGLLLNKTTEDVFTGKIFVRRTDSSTNFTKWIDIKEIDCYETDISTLGLFYDYTIESGVWYKYAVQVLLPGQSFRSKLLYPKDGTTDLDEDYAIRDFNYSFLLGENNQQLKLKFDNTMGSFKYQVMESKTETVGGKYPFIARNTAVYYRFFPITGLISFQMDENKCFCKEENIFKWETVRSLYAQYKADRRISNQYDYIYEREFRNEVIKFLHDGKPKLFKSPTEGNIIVRLMDINLTPNQTLGRMIYSFSSNANEIAENNLDNQSLNKWSPASDVNSENPCPNRKIW